jgi:azurin
VVPVVAAGRGGSEADAPAESTDEAATEAVTDVTIMFEAPRKPGAYTYVCTYPGHYATMQGTMRVVDS